MLRITLGLILLLHTLVIRKISQYLYQVEFIASVPLWCMYSIVLGSFLGRRFSQVWAARWIFINKPVLK